MQPMKVFKIILESCVKYIMAYTSEDAAWAGKALAQRHHQRLLDIEPQ